VRANNPKTLPAINAYLRDQGLKHLEVRAEQLQKLGIEFRRNRGYIVVEEEEDPEAAFKAWIGETQPSNIAEIEAKRKELRMPKVKVSEADLRAMGIIKLAGRFILGAEESREEKVAKFQQWVRDTKPTKRDQLMAKRKELGLTPEKVKPETLLRDGVAKSATHYVVVG
jgi:hypothetical protein